MRSNNVLGVIFANTNDDKIPELTAKRTMGSIPFGCRYRLVDFMLSSMVNAGISSVVLITKHNFQSLSDHVGSGRYWDLSRKRGGLVILSPFSSLSNRLYKGKIDALYGGVEYFEKTFEDYVLIADSNLVTNFDVDRLIDFHSNNNADITVAYKRGVNSDHYVELEGKKVTNFAKSGDYAYLNILLIKKELLIKLVWEAHLYNYTDLVADILKRNINDYKICGFEVVEHVLMVDSIQSYFKANMSLLSRSIRDRIFNMENPIYTKLRDDMPSRYGFGSSVSDSMIADGCVIDGEVKNSIIFRGVKIEKGAKVENCILMQSTIVEKNTQLAYVISDKNVVFKGDRRLEGSKANPVIIGKGLIV